MPQRQSIVILIACVLSMLAYLFSAMLLQPSAAQAHAFVIGSDPVDGSAINRVPAKVRIFFNAPLGSASVAHVYSIQNGNLIDIGASSSVIAVDNARELITPIKMPQAQPQGSYEIKWNALASDDGHTTFGIIGFNVGFASTGISTGSSILGPTSSNTLTDIQNLDPTNNPTNIIGVIWDWLVLSTLLFWLGTLFVEAILQTHKRPEVISQIKTQTKSLQALCLAILLFGESILLIIRTSSLTQILQGGFFSFTQLANILIGTSYGHMWLLRIALIVLTIASLYRAQRAEGTTERKEEVTKRLFAIELVAAALILTTYALSREAAQVFQPHFSAILFSWLFFSALGLWSGGFAYLAFILLPSLTKTESDNQAQELYRLLRRLTPFFLAAITILLASMLFFSEISISDAKQWLNDPYGRTLLVQLALVLIMTLLSLYLLFVQVPKLANPEPLFAQLATDETLPGAREWAHEEAKADQRNVQLQANILTWLAASVLLCTALLSFFAPPIVYPNITYSNQTASPASTSITQTKQIGDLTVTLQVFPNKVGEDHTIIMRLKDKNNQSVGNADVQIKTNMQIMDMGTGKASASTQNTIYVATFEKNATFGMAGLWVLTIEIQRPGQPSVEGNFQVMLNP